MIVLAVVTGWQALQSLAVPLGVWGVLALGAFALTFSKGLPKVASVRGTAKLTMDSSKGSAYHVLIVGGTYFHISAAAYDHLTEGAAYAVYYIPMHSNVVLSLEEVR